MEMRFDVVVVGAGHAGCEAAAAAARLGTETLLVTMDMNKIAQMSCNPAIGGIAKGQIVREIDALGGWMGIVTDDCAIQFRMLNRSKGPAMWSPRAQCDRGKYIWRWRELLENMPHLHIWQDQVMELLVDNGAVCGVRTLMGVDILAPAVVVCAGTFLNGLMHIGSTKIAGGRIAEPASTRFGESIARHGITTGRMKTGTPVRIDGRTVHFDEMVRQDGENTASINKNELQGFSYLSRNRDALPQLPCWTLYTNAECHAVLHDGLPYSPLYNGQIQSIGPRYCPSIETKIVTFPEREQHQLFLEPEGTDTQEFYLNGFSSSLPLEVQIEALRKIPALRDVEIYRPGYAIEYDYFDPTQLRHTLESKVVAGLYLAGQVNGTTGYEEAAGQGLVAGANAALKLQKKPEFVMHRDESYIGVLIDDLVTKGVDEPYRMFTSRAEFRILLRQDNADDRLTKRGYDIGLVSQSRYDEWITKKSMINRIIDFVADFSIKPDKINPALTQLGTSPLDRGCKLVDLIMRPELTFHYIAQYIQPLAELLSSCSNDAVEAAEIKLKYSGYIKREREYADKMLRLENIRIKDKFDYTTLQSLSTESRQKLDRINPETLAQASRIPGVSPSDINVLLVLLGR